MKYFAQHFYQEPFISWLKQPENFWDILPLVFQSFAILSFFLFCSNEDSLSPHISFTHIKLHIATANWLSHYIRRATATFHPNIVTGNVTIICCLMLNIAFLFQFTTFLRKCKINKSICMIRNFKISFEYPYRIIMVNLARYRTKLFQHKYCCFPFNSTISQNVPALGEKRWDQNLQTLIIKTYNFLQFS